MTIRPLIATPSRTLFALPYWIAVHRDFFKDEGLAPDLEFVASGELINNGLRSGRIDLAIGPPDGVMLLPMDISTSSLMRPRPKSCANGLKAISGSRKEPISVHLPARHQSNGNSLSSRS